MTYFFLGDNVGSSGEESDEKLSDEVIEKKDEMPSSSHSSQDSPSASPSPSPKSSSAAAKSPIFSFLLSGQTPKRSRDSCDEGSSENVTPRKKSKKSK